MDNDTKNSKLRKVFPDLPEAEYEGEVEEVSCSIEKGGVPQPGTMWVTPHFICFRTKILRKLLVTVDRDKMTSLNKNDMRVGQNVHPSGVDVKTEDGNSMSSLNSRTEINSTIIYYLPNLDLYQDQLLTLQWLQLDLQ